MSIYTVKTNDYPATLTNIEADYHKTKLGFVRFYRRGDRRPVFIFNVQDVVSVGRSDPAY